MKVLLIDDHPLILSALQTVILGLGDDVSVMGVATARAAREALQQDPDFDLVLLDLTLGDADGFEVLSEFRSTYPAVPVVVISASDRSSDVIRSIDLGAMGFVPKRASNEQLFDALHLVLSGGIYVPTMLMRADKPADVLPSETSPAALHAPKQHDIASLGFTPRQTDVLALLLQGKPNKLIARELQLSVETVKDHVAAVLRVLKVSSRTQAVLAVGQMSQRQGLLGTWRKSG